MVGQVADGEEAVREIADVLPDMVVMDVMMPKKVEVEAGGGDHGSRTRDPRRHALGSAGEVVVVEAVTASASGCIQKETDRERLLGD